MANYYIEQHNKTIADAASIQDYLSGQYMQKYAGMMFDYGDERHVFEAMKYVKINSYRKSNTDKELAQKVLCAIKGGLASFFANKCAVGCFLTSDGQECSLFFASEGAINIGFDDYLRSAVPDITMETRFIDKDVRSRCTVYGGVIIGLPSQNTEYIDWVFDELKRMQGMVAILAWPTETYQSNGYKLGLMELYRHTEAIGGVDNTFGSSSRRTIQEVVPALASLNCYLKRETERWNEIENMWEVCVWFAADTEQNARRLGVLLSGALASEAAQYEGASIYAMTERSALREQSLFTPIVEYDAPPDTLPYGLQKSPLVTYLTTNEVATYFQLPLREHPGIKILDSSETPNPMQPFELNTSLGGDILLGQIPETKKQFWLNLADLNEHMLVTGATGSGKTNTVMAILQELYRNHVPFCVIESAKKDYWYLVDTIPDLDVYSAGQDAKWLSIDPFTPEYGTVIGNHIDSLLYAFSGAFEMETPTRLALSGLLKYAYIETGWQMDEIFCPKGKKCPTVQILIDLLPKFMERELSYGEEVSDNIRGSILNRLNTLNEGTVGSVINCKYGKPLSGEELCTGFAVIELDDFPIDVKPFIAELVLVKAGQYLRRQDAAEKLKNVIVLEEAHNIFSRVSTNGKETSKGIASMYFSSMLSEIREYGTGLIIADQGASQLNENAIANTKIKVLHSLGSKEDVDAEAYALHLSEYQKRLIPEMSKGVALISIRSKSSTWRVSINKTVSRSMRNIACLFCKHRRFCEEEVLFKHLRDDDYRLAMTSANILANRYDFAILKSLLTGIQAQYRLTKCDCSCILGYLLNLENSKCSDREKRRIIYLYNRG